MINSKILLSLEDQTALDFTGRINILNEENNQLLGVIILKEGSVAHAKYSLSSGERALVNMLMFEQKYQKLKCVVEPEIVSDIVPTMNLSFDEVVGSLKEILKKTALAHNLRPSSSLRLYINPDFLISGEITTPIEFDILCHIFDDSKVSKIYEICYLLEYEITNALVSLREKRAIKVSNY